MTSPDLPSADDTDVAPSTARPTSPGNDSVAEHPLPHPDPAEDEPRARPRSLDPGRSVGRGPFLLALFVVGVLSGSTLLVTGFLLGRQAGSTPGTAESRQALFAPFWDAYNKIDRDYIGEVDERKLVQGAIKGVFDALGDPYSGYMSPDDYDNILSSISGQFEGIGADMMTRDAAGTANCSPIGNGCRAIVSRPLRGSPALRAGLQPGDVIVAVDGAATDGLTLDQVVERVRGPRGSSVTLGITRGEGARFDVPIVRDVIQRQDVESEVLADGTVGYLRIEGFSSSSATDLRTQLSELVQEKGLKRIVLDLRDDPGGFVEAARTIASEFIPEGTLYWEQAADAAPVPVVATPGGVATDPSIQLVVLVNRGSASASEIVAAALQETGRARLVGETTFGKGTIQQWHPLGDSGGFRLSVAKWLTPKQDWVDGKGVVPDVHVTVPDDVAPGVDPQLDRALELLGVASTAVAAHAGG